MISPTGLPSAIDRGEPDQIGMVEFALGSGRQALALDVKLDTLQRFGAVAVVHALHARHYALGRQRVLAILYCAVPA